MGRSADTGRVRVSLRSKIELKHGSTDRSRTPQSSFRGTSLRFDSSLRWNVHNIRTPFQPEKIRKDEVQSPTQNLISYVQSKARILYPHHDRSQESQHHKVSVRTSEYSLGHLDHSSTPILSYTGGMVYDPRCLEQLDRRGWDDRKAFDSTWLVDA